jgi:hypothetical protein
VNAIISLLIAPEQPRTDRILRHCAIKSLPRWRGYLKALIGYALVFCSIALYVHPAAGRDASEVTVTDLHGKIVHPLAESPAALSVFLFLRTDCPISNSYAPTIKRLHDDFAPQKVSFWLVYMDATLTLEAIREHLRLYNLPGRAASDSERKLTKLSKVTVTPEAAVFAPGGKLVYHGRIDNRYAALGVRRPVPTIHDLRDTLRDVLQGKPAPKESTPAIGCFIEDRE